MIVAIVNATDNENELWPGYRTLPQARRAMAYLRSRFGLGSEYRRVIGTALGLDDSALTKVWPALATTANGATLGQRYFGSRTVNFPEQID